MRSLRVRVSECDVYVLYTMWKWSGRMAPAKTASWYSWLYVSRKWLLCSARRDNPARPCPRAKSCLCLEVAKVCLALSLSLSLSGMSHPATHTIQVVKSSFAKLCKAAIKSTTSYYQRLDCWGRFELLVALSTNSIPLYYYCVYVANWHRLQFRRGLLRPTAPPSHVCCSSKDSLLHAQ